MLNMKWHIFHAYSGLKQVQQYLRIKTEVEFRHTTRFWNNVHKVRPKLKGKPNNVRLGAINPKDHKRIVKIGQGHICTREEN